VAFGLALAPRLLGTNERFEAKSAGAPRALIVCPTRELAQQVQRELAWLYADTGARMTTCVGGMDPRRERHELERGVHIVVGTPGRLCDHLERGNLSLARIDAVVLDEADEMLDMGFREDLERLLQAMPVERRTLMFSATIPPAIAQIAKKYQKKALRIAATSEDAKHRDIEYHAVVCMPREREFAVVNLLRYHDPPGALVFCATRDGVTHLAANLSERGFSVAALSGELSQRERNQALQALRDGRARVCVATDVAARGLDLPDLGLVIHGDLPQNAQTLVHRSGRTGRAGKHGLAILIVPEPARRYVERMLHTAKVDASWRQPPSADDIRARDHDLLVKELRTLAQEPSDDDKKVAAQLLAETPADALVAALVRIRREARPEPEEITPPRQAPPRHAPGKQPPTKLAPAKKPGRAERRVENKGNPNGPDRRRINKGSGEGKGTHGNPSGREFRGKGGGGVWFTVNVGRSKNADPKWLIPLLCRRGDITKASIGKIQILMRETRVEIAPGTAAHFSDAVRRPDAKDPNIHIEPLDTD
jgi:ATP-dependent RNA helicase DeaD